MARWWCCLGTCAQRRACWQHTTIRRCVGTSESLTAQQFADLTSNNVVRLHGLPDEVVSNRGPHFNSQFWGSVCKLLGVRRSMSSAYHPQPDRQTERTIRTIDAILRSYVSPDQMDRDRLLPWAESAYNNAWCESALPSSYILGSQECNHSWWLPEQWRRLHDIIQLVQLVKRYVPCKQRARRHAATTIAVA